MTRISKKNEPKPHDEQSLNTNTFDRVSIQDKEKLTKEQHRFITMSEGPSLSEAEVLALSDDHAQCLVCYSDLTIRGKTPCDHNDICGKCHLRLRFLHEDKKCPICKTSNDTIIVDGDAQKSFDDYPMWGNEIGGGFFHREDVGMFFESQYYYLEILPLFGYTCQQCDFSSEFETGQKKTPLKSLQEHLKSQHRLSLCQLCVDNKRDFVSCLPRMTTRQLQNHLKNGDGPTSGFFGHPACKFCHPKRFYDLAALHQHLHKEHYKCHVCEKQGLNNQFFKNYKSLEKHFDQQHFLCHDAQCLAARFVVFENEIDFRAHEMSVHGGTSTGSTKINIEFKTRRVGYDGSGVDEQELPSESDFNYGLDGQAFVPADVPNSSATDGNQLHPLHMQRTEELRAQAAAIREQQASENQVESFPSLDSSVTNQVSSAPLVGWASASTVQRLQGPKKNAGKVTEEDFPTLPSGAMSKSNAKKKAMRGNIGATRKQYAAMQSSASVPVGSYGAAAARSQASRSFPVAPINQQAHLAANNFPALGPSLNSRSSPYAAANALARKNLKQAPSINSQSDFPSMASIASTKPSAKVNYASVRAPPPSLSNSMDFPPPPSRSNDKKSVRQQVMGESKMPSQQAMSNMLQVDTPSATATATVEEMKASLGPNKFKQLKRLTKSFAEDQLSPEGYVDQSAALFDRGYGDQDFWKFLPSLLESCPNSEGSQHALKYMTSLRRQASSKPTRSAPAFVAPPPAVSSWGGKAQSKVMKKPPPTRATPVPMTMTRPMAARHHTVPSKKKAAWGASGAPVAVRNKAPQGSLVAAAGMQGPQGGTATKFMAKQQKKQKSQAQQQTKKNKKKEKDELRALAFGI